MAFPYAKVGWVEEVTPTSAANLGQMDQGIADAHTAAFGLKADFCIDTNVNVSSGPAAPYDLQSYALSPVGLRFLLIGQTNPVENGLWQHNGVGNPMTRPAEYPAGLIVPDSLRVSVKQGRTYAGVTFTVNVGSASSGSTAIVGTNTVTFQRPSVGVQRQTLAGVQSWSFNVNGENDLAWEYVLYGLLDGGSSNGVTDRGLLLRPNNVSTGSYSGVHHRDYFDSAAGHDVRQSAGGGDWNNDATNGMLVGGTNWLGAGFIVARGIFVGASTAIIPGPSGGRPLNGEWTFRANNPTRMDTMRVLTSQYFSDLTTAITNLTFFMANGTFRGTCILRSLGALA